MARAHGATARQPRPLTGARVLACLLGFFGVVAGANAILIHFAVSTFGGVETASSYQAGLAFSREAAAARAQDELHWRVTAHVTPMGETSAIDIDARNAAGERMSGLEATARLVHPTDRRGDHAVALTEIAPGQFRGKTEIAPGQWDLVIELSRGGDRLFRSRNRVVLR